MVKTRKFHTLTMPYVIVLSFVRLHHSGVSKNVRHQNPGWLGYIG